MPTTLRIRSGATLVSFVALALASSCRTDFPPESKVDNLRVLATQANPPYAHPNQPVSLRMLVLDGKSKPASPREIEVAWLGACTNPPGDEYTYCMDRVSAAIQKSGGYGSYMALAPSNAISSTLEASFVVRGDILEGRPSGGDGLPPHGTVIIPLAACAGRLESCEGTLCPETSGPVRCVDPQGEPVGVDDMVTAFGTVRVYSELTNSNPIIEGGTVAGISTPLIPCAQGSCDDGFACSSKQECIPVVARCTESSRKNCPDIGVVPLVSHSSVEVNTEALNADGQPTLERIAASFFATGGDLANDTRLLHDPERGWQEQQGTTWHAPAETGEIQFVVVIRDNRGGVSWWRAAVMVQ